MYLPKMQIPVIIKSVIKNREYIHVAKINSRNKGEIIYGIKRSIPLSEFLDKSY